MLKPILKQTLFPVTLFLFWLGVFSYYRLFFASDHLSLSDISFDLFIASLPLDISVGCYLLSIPLLLYTMDIIVKADVLRKISLTLSFLFLITVSLIETSSIPLYQEWNTTLNAQALSYTKSINELINTTNYFIDFKLVIILITGLVIGGVGLRKIHTVFNVNYGNKSSALLINITLLLLTFIGIRGGLGKLPINLTAAFFSSKQNVNYTALNKPFYLIKSLTENNIKTDLEDISHLKKFKDEYLYQHKSPEIALFKTKKPNIILVIMESLTADVLAYYGDTLNIMPNLNKLQNEGYLFSNIHSSGVRTDQGILNILSGVPSLPGINVMDNIGYVAPLPSLISDLNSNNYDTQFIYGGNLNFSNFTNYFIGKGTNSVYEQKDFEKATITDWGIPDVEMFTQSINWISDLNEPFFSSILTLSSHPPFEIPTEYEFGEANEKEKFKSTARYLDTGIGEFIDAAKKQPWFNNSVFLFVADHSCMYLGNRKYKDHDRQKIPLVIWGPQLTNTLKGIVNNTLGNHSDIPAILLPSLGINAHNYPFSKNLLNKTNREYSFWGDAANIGWLTPDMKNKYSLPTLSDTTIASHYLELVKYYVKNGKLD